MHFPNLEQQRYFSRGHEEVKEKLRRANQKEGMRNEFGARPGAALGSVLAGQTAMRLAER